MPRQKLKLVSAPPELINPVEWSVSNLLAPRSYVRGGNIRLEPWQAQIAMDWFNYPGSIFGLMCSSGSGKTALATTLLFYIMDIVKHDFLLAYPTQNLWFRDKKNKFIPMLEANPELSRRIGLDRNTPFPHPVFNFKGGAASVGWAGSEGTMQGDHLPFVFGEEVDQMSSLLDEDSNPLDNLEHRTVNWSHLSRVFFSSTPLDESSSNIYRIFKLGDQREFVVKCVHCDKEDFFTFENMNVHDGSFWCKLCGARLLDDERFKMLSSGLWVPMCESPVSPRHRTYHLSQFCSRFVPVDRIFAAYKSQTWAMFSKSALGMPYILIGNSGLEKSALKRLYKPNKFSDVRPEQVTCGVDVGKHEIYYVIDGWYNNEEHQRTLRASFIARVSEDPFDLQPWEQLRKLTNEYGVNMIFIDGSYDEDVVRNALTTVYKSDFARERAFLIKGDRAGSRADYDSFIRPNRTRSAGEMQILQINTHLIKSQLVGLMQDLSNDYIETVRISADHRKVAPGFKEHLTSEHLVKIHGAYQWVVKYSGKPNHFWDCKVYSWAARRQLLSRGKTVDIPAQNDLFV